MGICRHCGFPTVLLGAKFCPECGKPLPEALDDPLKRRENSKTGKCRICGYQPVAFDAAVCPSCGGKSPNPGTVSRYVRRGTFIGLLVGGVSGAALGLIIGGTGDAAFWGFLMGFGPGILGGLIIGSFGGGVVAGMRGE